MCDWQGADQPVDPDRWNQRATEAADMVLADDNFATLGSA